MSYRALKFAFGIALVATLLTPVRGQQAKPADTSSAAQTALLDKYCVTCHSDKARTGGLSLEHADLADIPKNAETWEKLIRKVRVGMMPPAGMPRPDSASLDGLASFF